MLSSGFACLITCFILYCPLKQVIWAHTANLLCNPQCGVGVYYPEGLVFGGCPHDGQIESRLKILFVFIHSFHFCVQCNKQGQFLSRTKLNKIYAVVLMFPGMHSGSQGYHFAPPACLLLVTNDPLLVLWSKR